MLRESRRLQRWIKRRTQLAGTKIIFLLDKLCFQLNWCNIRLNDQLITSFILIFSLFDEGKINLPFHFPAERLTRILRKPCQFKVLRIYDSDKLRFELK
jgi:hypothetical protein